MNKAKEIEKIKKRIIPIASAEPHVKVLVYGRNGAGKTRFAASGPKPLIVDINEKGTQSARSFKGAEVLQAAKWEDLTYAYWYLKEGSHPYKTVVLDTLTMMQDMCMRHVLKEAEDRDPNREPSMPDRRSWGKVGELMKPLMLNFRNLPMHVVFTAQERVVGDPEEDEILEHVPNLSPGSRGTATACVGLIGRMYQKEVRVVNKKTKKETSKWEQRMLIGPREDFITKNRISQELGNVLRSPTMPQIIAAAASVQED